MEGMRVGLTRVSYRLETSSIHPGLPLPPGADRFFAPGELGAAASLGADVHGADTTMTSTLGLAGADVPLPCAQSIETERSSRSGSMRFSAFRQSITMRCWRLIRPASRKMMKASGEGLSVNRKVQRGAVSFARNPCRLRRLNKWTLRRPIR